MMLVATPVSHPSGSLVSRTLVTASAAVYTTASITPNIRSFMLRSMTGRSILSHLNASLFFSNLCLVWLSGCPCRNDERGSESKETHLPSRINQRQVHGQ